MFRCVLLSFGSARLVRRARINSLWPCVALALIDRSSRHLFDREGTTLFVLATGGQPLWSSVNNAHSASGQAKQREQSVWIVDTGVIKCPCLHLCMCPVWALVYTFAWERWCKAPPCLQRRAAVQSLAPRRVLIKTAGSWQQAGLSMPLPAQNR